jgi:hypothetical protein
VRAIDIAGNRSAPGVICAQVPEMAPPPHPLTDSMDSPAPKKRVSTWLELGIASGMGMLGGALVVIVIGWAVRRRVGRYPTETTHAPSVVVVVRRQRVRSLAYLAIGVVTTVVVAEARTDPTMVLVLPLPAMIAGFGLAETIRLQRVLHELMSPTIVARSDGDSYVFAMRDTQIRGWVRVTPGGLVQAQELPKATVL